MLALVSSVLYAPPSLFFPSNISLHRSPSPCTTKLHACSHTFPVSASAVPVIPSERSRILRCWKGRRLKPQCQFRLVVLVRQGIKTISSCYMIGRHSTGFFR